MSASPRQETANLELRDYMSILRRRKALIALITAVVVLVALAYSLTRTPLYRARAQVLFSQRQSDLIMDYTPAEDDDAVRSELSLMDSGSMRRAVRENLGYLPEPDLSANPSIRPGVQVEVTHTDAEQAAKEANDFATAYVTERRKVIADDIRVSMDEVEQQLNGIVTEVAAAQNRRQQVMVEIALEENKPEPDQDKLRVLRVQAQQLSAQVDSETVVRRSSTLQNTLDRLQTAHDSIIGGGRFSVAEANVPEEPFSPQPARTAGLALAGGLALGLAAAFLRDYLDDTLRTKEDLDAATGGVPVLGIIPAIDEWRDRSTALLESVSHPNSAASEAYRSLRTSIDFISVDDRIDIIHVTSSTSGEGKSTTSANLAVTLARAGKRVILIDCDLRRPRLHHFFGLDNSVGFTSVVLGSTRVEDALEPVAGVPGLLVLPSGPPPPNPSELLSTRTVQTKLETFSHAADYVVIDSPPLLPVSDSVVLAGLADLTLLVVTARTTARRSLHRSLELLEQVNAPLGGIVFNGVGHEGTYGYGYGYGYTAYAPRSSQRGAGASLPAEPAPVTSSPNGHGRNSSGAGGLNGHGEVPDYSESASGTGSDRP